jgi:hypothetical protein
MAEQVRGVGNLWLNGTLIRSGLQYRVQFEQRGITGHISGSIDVDPCGDGAALIAMKGISEPNSDLVLELQDGRRWHCTLKNNLGELGDREGFDERV